MDGEIEVSMECAIKNKAGTALDKYIDIYVGKM